MSCKLGHSNINEATANAMRISVAIPNQTFTLFNGSVDIVGAVKYQWPNNIPETAAPETQAVAISDSQYMVPSSVCKESTEEFAKTMVTPLVIEITNAATAPPRRLSSVHKAEPINETPAIAAQIQATIEGEITLACKTAACVAGVDDTTSAAVGIWLAAIAASTDMPNVTNIWIRKNPDVTRSRGITHHTMLIPQIRRRANWVIIKRK
jgi:hypothetical protein